MRTQLFLFIFGTLVCFTKLAKGQSTQHAVSMATDSGGYHLFTDNPAAADPDQFSLSFLQVQRDREVKEEFDSDPVDLKVEHKSKETNYALGLLYPVGGGAAMGLSAEIMHQDLNSKIDLTSRDHEESFEKRLVGGRFILKLVDKIRVSVGLRFATLNNKILGDFFASDDEAISYQGTMSGFTTGLFFSDAELNIGIAYTGPLRGKAKIGDEKIIVGEAGYLNLDVLYGEAKEIRYGGTAKRWLHKRDDRSKEYEVPGQDDRNISLNGLDLEQFLLPTIQYSLGIDSARFNDIFARFSVSQTEYSFLFESDQVPGDDPDLETKIRAIGAKLALVYNPSDFSIQLGYAWEQRKASTIDDTESWFAGDYLDYNAKDTAFFVTFNYSK